MKRIILTFAAFVFVLAGCGNSNAETAVSDVSEVFNDYLNISPYIPSTDYEIGAVIMEYRPGTEDQDPFHATINYYDSLGKLEELDDESKEWWKENTTERDLVYGDLYEDPSAISIEIYPAGKFGGMVDAGIIELAGHEVQYQSLKQGTSGRNSDHIFIAINFDDVSYVVQYNDQSENAEKNAKKLAENIIENNK